MHRGCDAVGPTIRLEICGDDRLPQPLTPTEWREAMLSTVPEPDRSSDP